MFISYSSKVKKKKNLRSQSLILVFQFAIKNASVQTFNFDTIYVFNFFFKIPFSFKFLVYFSIHHF